MHLAVATGRVVSFQRDWQLRSKRPQPSRHARRLLCRDQVRRSHTATSRSPARMWQVSVRCQPQEQQAYEFCAIIDAWKLQLEFESYAALDPSLISTSHKSDMGSEHLGAQVVSV